MLAYCVMSKNESQFTYSVLFTCLFKDGATKTIAKTVSIACGMEELVSTSDGDDFYQDGDNDSDQVGLFRDGSETHTQG